MDLGKLAELSRKRVCQECGAEFEESEKQSALEQFSDHLTVHQPTPGQWQEASKMIDRSRGKSG